MDILSLLIFIPLLFGLVVLALPLKPKIAKYIGFFVSFITLFLGLKLFFDFQTVAKLQFETVMPWIANYGIVYHIGVDGISLFILMSTVFLMPLIYIFLWHQDKKGYWANVMILQGSVTGALLSMDLILFYLFWEMMLLPIFFMIGMYGSGEKRATALKVTLYTMFGSFLMLVSILYLGFHHFKQLGFWSFTVFDLQNVALSADAIIFVFIGFILAFAIKIPFFPFHTWLPQTYSDAPTATVVILSSIMAKLGVYALIRFVFPIFPELIAEYSYIFMTIGVIGLIYFGIGALMQNDIKKMLAYSSASHLSMIVVGLFSLNIIGAIGSIYLIVAHAISTGALFLMVDYLEKHTGTREINKLGGLAKNAPIYTLFFAFFMLTVIGLPSTSGFASELLIIFGVFKESMIIGIITTASVLISVSFMLWMFGRVLLGGTKNKLLMLPDLNFLMVAALLPIMLLILAMGVYPFPFINLIEPSLVETLKVVKP